MQRFPDGLYGASFGTSVILLTNFILDEQDSILFDKSQVCHISNQTVELETQWNFPVLYVYEFDKSGESVFYANELFYICANKCPS